MRLFLFSSSGYNLFGMKKLFFLFSGLFPVLACTQIQQTFHEVMEISDSVELITYEFYDSLEVNAWPNNNLMMEIIVSHTNSTDALMKALFKGGRYALKPEKSLPSLKLRFKLRHRGIIDVPGRGTVDEKVMIRLFIPDSFAEVKPGEWTRKSKK
jgi:hypothetical protein